MRPQPPPRETSARPQSQPAARRRDVARASVWPQVACSLALIAGAPGCRQPDTTAQAATPASEPKANGDNAQAAAAAALPNAAKAGQPTADETTATAAPSAPAGPSGTAAPAGMGEIADRRLRPRPIIGGCRERCGTAEQAATLLLERLGTGDPDETLYPLFEWSLLVVNGEALGDRWAGLWADPLRHGERQTQIDGWLRSWASWTGRIAEKEGLVRLRAQGVEVEPMKGHEEPTARFALRHPRLRDDASAPVWRIELTLRGHEWLISGIDDRR